MEGVTSDANCFNTVLPATVGPWMPSVATNRLVPPPPSSGPLRTLKRPIAAG